MPAQDRANGLNRKWIGHQDSVRKPEGIGHTLFRVWAFFNAATTGEIKGVLVKSVRVKRGAGNAQSRKVFV